VFWTNSSMLISEIKTVLTQYGLPFLKNWEHIFHETELGLYA